MTTTEELDLIEEEVPGSQTVSEVAVQGDEAVIRVKKPEGVVEERKVKLPKTTWG